MGRRKIEIKKIEKKAYLKATFSKRRKGLFRKARELCNMCGAEIAILTISPGGRFYNFGLPNVDSVVARYCGDEIPIITNEHPECVISEEDEEDDDEDVEGEQKMEVEVSTDPDTGSSSSLKAAGSSSSLSAAVEEKELVKEIKEMNLIELLNRERDGRMRESLLLQKFWWNEEEPNDPEEFRMYHRSLTQLRNNVVSVLNDRSMRESYAKDYISMI